MPSGTGTCHSRNTVRRAPASVSIPVRPEFGDFSGGVTQADMQEDTALRSVSGDLEPKWECVGYKAWGLLSLNPVTAQLPGGSEATFCLRPGSREAWCPLSPPLQLCVTPRREPPGASCHQARGHGGAHSPLSVKEKKAACLPSPGPEGRRFCGDVQSCISLLFTCPRAQGKPGKDCNFTVGG